MKVEVMGSVEFNFDSACTSPYVSAPSTPRGFGSYFFSAPTSPTHFNWQQNPLISPFTKHNNDHNNPDFEFDFNCQSNAPPLSADELFYGGKIKPIQLNPELRFTDSPKSPRSPKRMIFKDGLSPRKKNRDFVQANRRTPRGHVIDRHEGLAPLRVCDILLEEEEEEEEKDSSKHCSSSSPSSWCKRWNLKDLLFRNKSEGQKSEIEYVKNSSFRSTEIVNSVHSTKRRKGKGKGKGGVSAHELHYKVNRAMSEEMRRKTFLPYRKTVLLGC